MTEAVEITQADREAAASIAVLAEMRELILSGRADHHAEPFARHRIAHQQDIAAQREDAARQALEAAAGEFLVTEVERVGVPCPDNIKGCAVFHFREVTRTRGFYEVLNAIRAIDPARFRGEG